MGLTPSLDKVLQMNPNKERENENVLDTCTWIQVMPLTINPYTGNDENVCY